MNKTLIILAGASGSGKTTFRKNLERALDGAVVINMDNIRREMSDVNDQSLNHLVAGKAQAELKKAFADGKSVIWDNTTLTPKYFKAVYKEKPEDYDFDFFYTERSLDPDKCIKSIQDEVKSNVDRANVPGYAVYKQAEKLKNLLDWLKTQPELKDNISVIPEF